MKKKLGWDERTPDGDSNPNNKEGTPGKLIMWLTIKKGVQM